MNLEHDIVGHLEQAVLEKLTPVGHLETATGLVMKPSQGDYAEVADILLDLAPDRRMELLLLVAEWNGTPDDLINGYAAFARTIDEATA